MKKIGIVGGVGPLAGLDLNHHIFTQTQTQADQHHIPVLLNTQSHRIADRTQFLLGNENLNPGHALGQIATELINCGCQGICIPCNTAHHPDILTAFFNTINRADFTFLSLTQSVADFLENQQPKITRVGLLATLGTYTTKIYEKALNPKGIEVIAPMQAGCEQVHSAIYHPRYGVKTQSAVTQQASQILHQHAQNLTQAGAQAVLMACTEIPLVFNQTKPKNITLLNPTLLLARAAVAFSDPNKLKPYVA